MVARTLYTVLSTLLVIVGCKQPEKKNVVAEQYRPLIHFTPPANWMNDPNGMVYHEGTYHLFYQYYPDSTVWGPMHWGHATSTNLVDWHHEPVALYPDSLGLIFSGSAVVDYDNTSGFGINGKAPLVAIFTHHGEKDNKAMTNTAEVQSIAYSNDGGKSWTKYGGNPVLPNPGISDFRDPKVFWFAPQRKWIMTLAVKDRIMFFSSLNLKQWQKESEFGADRGAHGGVWECPDLIQLPTSDGDKWVLIVNINPGAPNGGSGVQYFVGDFDGKTFTAEHTDTRWLDYGPDNYAGVTWSNTPGRTILLGWMSNWQYAQVVPTKKWRSSNTVPRQLALANLGSQYYVRSTSVAELVQLHTGSKIINTNKENTISLTSEKDSFALPCTIRFNTESAANWQFTLSNNLGEQVSGGYDKAANQFYLDRTLAGEATFDSGFARRHTAPRMAQSASIDITIILDIGSIELFADDGLSVLTQLHFPSETFTTMQLQSTKPLQDLRYIAMRPAIFTR